MSVPFDSLALISLLPILRHHRVADIGCGAGAHTTGLAKYLFLGKVFALDIEQEKLDATRAAVESVHLTNVDVMPSEQDRIPLDDDSLDGALASKVLHHAEDPEALLQDARRCLKASGWLAIVENYEGDHSVDIDKMQTMAESAGFRRTASRDIDGKQYMMTVRK